MVGLGGFGSKCDRIHLYFDIFCNVNLTYIFSQKSEIVPSQSFYIIVGEQPYTWMGVPAAAYLMGARMKQASKEVAIGVRLPSGLTSIEISVMMRIYVVCAFTKGPLAKLGRAVEANSLSAAGSKMISRPSLTALKNDKFGTLIHHTAKASSCRESRCGLASFNHSQINPGLYQNRFNAL